MTDITLTIDEMNLLGLMERIARQVCNGGVVTRAESEERERLEALVGRTWDAINRRWVDLA